jgi:hypothetical protein
MLVVTEQIVAYLVCDTEQRRNQVSNVIGAYLDRQKAGARDFVLFDVPPGKYGTGPTLVVSAPFLSRTDADNAWADLSGVNPTWLIAGSIAEQFTSTEDIEQNLNETVYIHRLHWPSQPDDF